MDLEQNLLFQREDSQQKYNKIIELYKKIILLEETIFKKEIEIKKLQYKLLTNEKL